jgi:serine/threonine protein kinase
MDAVAQAGLAPAASGAVSTPVLVGGRYELGTLIGQGGSGEVYEGLDRSLRRPVAVKMFHDAEPSEKHSARFDQEVRLHAQLHHSSLIPLLDAGTEGGRRYLVMPLVQGMTLAARISEGPLAGPDVERIGIVLAGALECVHAAGVVHRDVKPSNILLGLDGQVFLADFGIASLCDGSRESVAPHFSLTGTAAYLSPEQVESGVIGYAGDVYALGLVLLEALTGVRAYHGTLLEQALARLWRQPEIPMSLSSEWAGLLATMTAREPAERPGPRRVAETLSRPDNAVVSALAVPAGRRPASVAQHEGPAQRSARFRSRSRS